MGGGWEEVVYTKQGEEKESCGFRSLREVVRKQTDTRRTINVKTNTATRYPVTVNRQHAATLALLSGFSRFQKK